MKNSTKALQMLKEKISKLEIHILFLYGLIFLIVFGFTISNILPVKKPVDNNFWDSALNDGECGC